MTTATREPASARFEDRLEVAVLDALDDLNAGSSTSPPTPGGIWAPSAATGSAETSSHEAAESEASYVTSRPPALRPRVGPWLAAAAAVVCLAGVGGIVAVGTDDEPTGVASFTTAWAPLAEGEWSYRSLHRTETGDVSALDDEAIETRTFQWHEELWVAPDSSGVIDSEQFDMGRREIQPGEVVIGGYRYPDHLDIVDDPLDYPAGDTPEGMRETATLVADALAFEATPPDARTWLLELLLDAGFSRHGDTYEWRSDEGHHHRLEVDPATHLLRSWEYALDGVIVESIQVDVLERRDTPH